MMTLLGCVHGIVIVSMVPTPGSCISPLVGDVVKYRVYIITLLMWSFLVVTSTQSLQREVLLAQQQLDCVSYILWDTCLASTGMHVPACCGCLCCMTI